jgi:hypothetical protein
MSQTLPLDITHRPLRNTFGLLARQVGQGSIFQGILVKANWHISEGRFAWHEWMSRTLPLEEAGQAMVRHAREGSIAGQDMIQYAREGAWHGMAGCGASC